MGIYAHVVNMEEFNLDDYPCACEFEDFKCNKDCGDLFCEVCRGCEENKEEEE